jgi:hypothetical protein
MWQSQMATTIEDSSIKEILYRFQKIEAGASGLRGQIWQSRKAGHVGMPKGSVGDADLKGIYYIYIWQIYGAPTFIKKFYKFPHWSEKKERKITHNYHYEKTRLKYPST